MQIARFIRCAVFALLVLAIPASSFAGVFVSVNIAPPVLPVYEQPPCPGDGYIWTPGYWAYGDDGYFWVPGTWVVAPQPGFLWTPGYWGWGEGVYLWHAGYWGPHVGFYGGVNYGFGYVGFGYAGGYWEGDRFYYNRSVNNVNITNVHIYNKTVINNVTVNNVSYNGGRGGINARPSHAEELAERERHFEPTRMQMEHEHGARGNRELLASVNHGRPPIAATVRPAEFHGHGVVPARAAGAPYRPTDNRAMADRGMSNRGGNRDMNRDMSHQQNSAPRPQDSRLNQDSVRNMDRRQNPAPRPQDSARNQGPARNMDRPMPRDNNYGNRGGQAERSAPRPENRGNAGGDRPSAYHGENARPRESAPARGEQGDKGREPRR